MPLLNFNFDLARARREREALERRKQAIDDFSATMAAGRQLPQPRSPFAGVSPDLTDADLEALVRNEEATRLAQEAQTGHEGRLFNVAAALQAEGIDPTKLLTARNQERQAADTARLWAEGRLTDDQYLDALGGRSTAPYTFGAGYAGNKYTGDQRLNATGEALATQRRAAAVASLASAGNSDALADYNRARGHAERFRNQAIEDILEEPTNPLLAADIVNRKTVAKPQRVKVHMRDGREQLMDAIPNQAGGFDYVPAQTTAGEPVISEPGGEDGTALQKDTAFIAQTLGIEPSAALRYKLQSARKAPEEAWAELVGRLVSAHKYAKPEQLDQKAREIWALMRPGEPVPAGTASAAGGAAAVDPAGDEEAEAVRRAEAEGYSNFGRWVPGRGLEILDDSGTVIGHYY